MVVQCHSSHHLLTDFTSCNTCRLNGISDLFCVCVGNHKLSLIVKDTKGLSSQYDELEMRPHTVTKPHSKSASEGQCEECGGVTSSTVTMEENPAYQTVTIAAAKPWTKNGINYLRLISVCVCSASGLVRILFYSACVWLCTGVCVL